MVETTARRPYERDWRVLKAVVAALWLTAGLTFLVTYFAAPQRDDIVLSGEVTPTAPLHLAGSSAR